uniref:Uncharacterized protein n=1 Tax=Physcomitrium patens TaxID=3218 RepID=A0A2K1K702_PHYPA|nr:hypothetical protein PHYPA_011456 [Physcomitrium patens]
MSFWWFGATSSVTIFFLIFHLRLEGDGDSRRIVVVVINRHNRRTDCDGIVEATCWSVSRCNDNLGVGTIGWIGFVLYDSVVRYCH